MDAKMLTAFIIATVVTVVVFSITMPILSERIDSMNWTAIAGAVYGPALQALFQLLKFLIPVGVFLAIFAGIQVGGGL
jgi:hypothetical protein